MSKICQQCKTEFQITHDDKSFYEKIKVPEPTLCPECRYQRRIANRNEYNFYKRDCTLCGKSMVSLYNSEYPGPVYCQPCYWSDNWDTMDYGRDFDFTKPFFEQFKEHRFTVPRIALASHNAVNSEYTNQCEGAKNCYMVITSTNPEDCMYSSWVQSSRECVDVAIVEGSESLYECLDCLKCYKSAFLETCVECTECYFGDDLRGCTNCFGCVGLRNKSYCWFNEQLTKEEYAKRFNEITFSNENIAEFREKLKKLRLSLPIKYYHGSRIENSTGDFIGFNKNVLNAFNSFKSENLHYGQDAWEAKDSMDLTETLNNELDYEMEGAGWCARDIVSCKQWYGHDVFYSELSFSSDNLFGCVSMKTKSYCIFNKQYSKEEYPVLKDRIVEHMKKTGEWGEFFPATISPFAYNDSVAQDYFPMTKNEVLSRGWKWYDRTSPLGSGTASMPKYKIGGDIRACKNKDSECKGVGAFRLHPAEMQFYEKMKLPIPDTCFPCRLKRRLNRRNPRKLWKRNCAKCGEDIDTSYSPNGNEIVYCEQCYNIEIN